MAVLCVLLSTLIKIRYMNPKLCPELIVHPHWSVCPHCSKFMSICPNGIGQYLLCYYCTCRVTTERGNPEVVMVIEKSM